MLYFLSDCSKLECDPGHKCEVFEPTGQPFCNPTCEVDNGGCGDDECSEQRTCSDPDQLCYTVVICTEKNPPTLPPGMAQVKCILTFIHTYTFKFTPTRGHTHAHKHTHKFM